MPASRPPALFGLLYPPPSLLSCCWHAIRLIQRALADALLQWIGLLETVTCCKTKSLPRRDKGNSAKGLFLRCIPKIHQNDYAARCFSCIFFRPDLAQREKLRKEQQNREKENLVELRSIRHRALMAHQILKKMSTGAMNSYFRQTFSKTVLTHE